MNATYGEDALSYDVDRHWHRQFRRGRRSEEMAPAPGRPQRAADEDTSHQGDAAILGDYYCSSKMLKLLLGLWTNIYDYPHMQKLSARWTPRLLTSFQKQGRVRSCKALLAKCQEKQEDLFDGLIM